VNILDNAEHIKKIDKDGMLGLVERFPAMIEDAVNICSSCPFKVSKDIENIVIAGMGGSAISGDIIKKLLVDLVEIPVSVVRDYSLPKFVGKKTLLFALSYSGDTEETLSAYSQAHDTGTQIVVVTSGGQLKEKAKKAGYQVVEIPKGLPPRACLPYLLVPMIYFLDKTGIAQGLIGQLRNAVLVLKKLKDRYCTESPFEANATKQIALKLQNKIPIIFGSPCGSDVAAFRWKTQFSENTKITALFNVFPELDHNEIVNLAELNAGTHQFSLILLRDKFEGERIKTRIDITKRILSSSIPDIHEVWSEGDTRLSRMLSLSYLGDYVSVYLAIANEVDPTPVLAIDKLKKELVN
jgi:glucose/mannose-6-phosphate isomerase